MSSTQDYRVVVYKDGSPSNKVLFDTMEDAQEFATTKREAFLAKVKSGKHSFNSPTMHYIAERNY
jgi:hypothetical protein